MLLDGKKATITRHGTIVTVRVGEGPKARYYWTNTPDPVGLKKKLDDIAACNEADLAALGFVVGGG